MKTNVSTWILLALLILVGSAGVGVAKDVMAYETAATRVVAIEAIVDEVDEYEDSDGYTQHDLYITYTYNGTQYRPEYQVDNASEWKDRIGEKIMIEIDPESPEEPVSNLINGRFVIYIGIAVWLLVGWIIGQILDKRWDCNMLPNRDVLHSKVCGWVKHRLVVPAMLLLWGGMLEYLHWNCPLGSHGMLFDIVGYVLIALAIWRLAVILRWWHMLRNGEYEVVYGTLAEKRYTEGDSDTADSYKLRFTDSHGGWTQQVDSRTYEDAREGDKGMAVYIPGKKGEILRYYESRKG